VPPKVACAAISVSNPAVFSSLTLAASPNNPQSVTESSAASITFPFETPILLEPGETEQFTLTRTIAGDPAPAKIRAGAMLGPLSGDGNRSGGFPPLAGGFALVAIAAAILMAGPRRKVVIVAASCLWLAFALNQTGCDPCPTCTSKPSLTVTPTVTPTPPKPTPTMTPVPATSSQTLESIVGTATGVESNIDFSGIRDGLLLSTITMTL
jgi:hypothetical protein